MSDPERTRVLFVDDEPEVTRSLRATLRRAPFEVVTCNGSEEALALLDEEDIAVVVSDERMPGMSGSELLTVVRQRHPDVMRIILTGQASMDATISAINDAAVFRFLSKPVSRDDLLDCIASALAARVEREADAARRAPGEADAARFARGLDQLWMAFQPLLSSETRGTCAFEALVRTNAADIQGPEDLIRLAEGLDRVVELESRIHEAIARALCSAPPDALFFVNLHPRSFETAELFEPDHPLVPFAPRVVLEVTERASLEALVDLEQKIEALRDRGFRIAVDDLGAGYAGLTSFARLSPQFVKFDMSLVRGIEQSETQRKLIRSMNDLCHELAIQTVGEGVETASERDHLTGLGCDLLQGYFHGRPAKPFAPGTWQGSAAASPSPASVTPPATDPAADDATS